MAAMRVQSVAALIGVLLLLRLDAAAPITVTAASRSSQPGELVVLTMKTGSPALSVRVHAFGRETSAFEVGSGKWRALVGIDLDANPGPVRLEIEARTAGRTVGTTYELHVKPKRFPTRTLRVDEAFVNPPADVQPRIELEAKELSEIWATSSSERLWNGPFVRPVPGEANSSFGTRSVFNGKPRNPHSGADFLSPAGTPIEAPNGGRVALARELYFSGNTVIIDHGLGLSSLLAHMSSIAVHDGDHVSAGDIVGRVGATGRVTGPHLHWAVRVNGARVDPLSLLALLGQD